MASSLSFRDSFTIRLLRAAVFGALGTTTGCKAAELGTCSDSPRPEDGLYPCENGLVRRQSSAGCSKDPDYPGTCESDADCGDRQACYCGPEGYLGEQDPRAPSEGHGRCVWASCRTGADCGAGNECVLIESSAFCAPGQFEFACSTGDDACYTDSDCGDGEGCTTNDGVMQCSEAGCGRPFLIDGAARVAEVTLRADWSAATTVRGPRSAKTSADFWLRTAQLEHASIAAFARFTLELLALGAPSYLVSGASRAMADEIKHAEIAFSLASAHAGRHLGPGPLPIDGSLSHLDPADVAERLFLEGCVGETVAAAEARSLAITSADEAARSALELIAVDETRHAELAWRALAWLLDVHPASRAGFDRGRASLGAASDDAQDLRGRVVGDVVRPACAHLVGDVAAPGRSLAGTAS